MSSSIQTEDLASDQANSVDALAEGNLFKETPFVYPDYTGAAKAASSWVTNGNPTGTPEKWTGQFVHYYATTGPYDGWLVGLGIQKTAVEYMIRLDFDPDRVDKKTGELKVGKGIHWNAKYKKNTDEKISAEIKGTNQNTTTNKKRYEGYLNKLKGKTPQKIWEAWSKGNAPELFEGVLDDEEEVAEQEEQA